ncbi:MAG: GntR family transcriptional regulator [Bryobacteraceae bacterium]|nr:GntR family transcriptional regulator [Bryobacteraceae bacterium]MDW8379211.1 GntR family transcriptional regulator [Bryobacterales bacterium]
MELTRLERRRAVDEVYDALRRAILGHVFRPGDRLQVEEIAQKLGVSLTPVRHAIQQLAAEGLIEIHPRSGTYVTRLSPRDVEETGQIRRALECLAGELAVKRITPAELEEMERLLAEMAQPVESEEDRKRHEENNRRFHLLLVRASGNRRLAEMYDSLNAHLQIARVHGAEQEWQSRLEQERAEHEEILGALRAGDALRLNKALTAHIDRAKEALQKALEGSR